MEAQLYERDSEASSKKYKNISVLAKIGKQKVSRPHVFYHERLPLICINKIKLFDTLTF